METRLQDSFCSRQDARSLPPGIVCQKEATAGIAGQLGGGQKIETRYF